MKNLIKKYSVFAVIGTLIALNTNISLAEKSVTIEDVSSAGFSSPIIQPPTDDGNYPGSATYFWVGNNTARSPAKNLVMVSSVNMPKNTQNLFSYGASQKDFPVSGGKGLEAILGGARTAINFLKNGIYVVIIGPNAAETETLATIVASKIK